MVLESSIVIHAIHVANVAHEWMNLCHVITHVIMIIKQLWTSTTFVRLTAVDWALIVLTVLASDIPACLNNRRHRKRSRRTCCPNLLRSSLTVTRGSQPGKSMLHPRVLPQSLVSGWFIVTLVTRKHIGSNFHFFNGVHCRRVLLLLPSLAFLRRVEGLVDFLLVSKETEKSGPMVKEKLKAWPWLASAWQKSMHLEAREVSTSHAAVILTLLLN